MGNETKNTIYEAIRVFFTDKTNRLGLRLGTVASTTNLDILQSNGTAFVSRQPVGIEASTIMNSTAANDTVVGQNVQRFGFFSAPLTAPYWDVTGIAWKNGTVINGNVNCAIFSVDAIYPVAAAVQVVAWGRQAAQSGASSTQRNSDIQQMCFLKAGGIYGVMINSSSASATFLTATVSSANNSKSISASADYPIGNTTAWAATTEEPYLQVFHKPVLGV